MPCMGPTRNEYFSKKLGEYLYQFNFVEDNGQLNVFKLEKQLVIFFKRYHINWAPDKVWSQEAIDKAINREISNWFYSIYGFLYLKCGDDGNAKPNTYTLEELKAYIEAVDFAEAIINF